MHLRSQHFIYVVSAQHNVHLPLTTREVQSLALRLLPLTHALQFISVALQQADLGKVLRVHQIDFGLERILHFVFNLQCFKVFYSVRWICTQERVYSTKGHSHVGCKLL
jgi:hypothetical protein